VKDAHGIWTKTGSLILNCPDAYEDAKVTKRSEIRVAPHELPDAIIDGKRVSIDPIVNC
jgi:hypothetical protein